MNVKDRLAGAPVTIEHQTVTILIDTLVSGDLLCHQHHSAGYFHVLFIEVIDGRDVLSGYDQNMRRCLRIDISEREYVVVLVDFVTGNFTIPDFAKQTISHYVPHARVVMSYTVYRLTGSRCS